MSASAGAAASGKAGVGMGMPRAPPASTHRRSHSLSQRPNMLKWGGIMGGGEREKEVPSTAGPELSTFAERMDTEKERDQAGEKERLRAEEREEKSPPPPMSPGATLVRKFGTLLGGSRGDESRRLGVGKRASILGGLSPRPSAEVELEKRREAERERERERERVGHEEKTVLPEETPTEMPKGSEKVGMSQSQPLGTVHRRAATILDPQGRAARHERRSSTSATIFSAGGTIGRNRRPSTSAGLGGGGGTIGAAGAGDRSFGRTDEVDETADEERIRKEEDARADGQDHDQYHDQERNGEKEFKPVFLKGLFRYVSYVTAIC